MEYKGKLYGKVGKSYFPLLHTTDDYDNLVKCVAELEALLEQKLNIHAISGKRPSWEKCSSETCTDLGVEKELCECYQAASAAPKRGQTEEQLPCPKVYWAGRHCHQCILSLNSGRP